MSVLTAVNSTYTVSLQLAQHFNTKGIPVVQYWTPGKIHMGIEPSLGQYGSHAQLLTQNNKLTNTTTIPGPEIIPTLNLFQTLPTNQQQNIVPSDIFCQLLIPKLPKHTHCL